MAVIQRGQARGPARTGCGVSAQNEMQDYEDMSEWKEYILSDVAEVQTGPFGSQLHQSDYQLVGTPIITVEHLGDNRIIHNNLPLVSDEDKERLKKYTLVTGDVVFSRVGSVDRCAYVHERENGWMFSGRLLRVRARQQQADPRFLSFYFSQESFKETIRMIAVGATMPSINTEILSNVNIFLPPLSEQKAIAGVLSSFDDKNDLLQRQNKTLEGMAEALWRKMFIEDADDSWAKGKLGDICLKITKGTTPTTLKKNFVDTGINFIKAESMDDNGCFLPEKFAFIDEETNKLLSRSIIQENDILYTIAGTIGRTAVVTSDILPANTNQAVAIIRLNNPELYIFYIRLLLKSVQMTDDLDSKVVHAVQPNLSLGMIAETEIVLPHDDILDEFNNKCLSLYLKINKNSAQIKTFSKIRDTLLPKLMSGEVRVKL